MIYYTVYFNNKVFAEATLIFPLLVAETFAKNFPYEKNNNNKQK